VKNLNYLIAAYAIFWLVLFVYVFSIDRRQKETVRQLARLLEPSGSDN